MSSMMDLVAGDQRDILTAIGTDDLAGLSDRRRFTAHLGLGAGLDPTAAGLRSAVMCPLFVRLVLLDYPNSSSNSAPSTFCPPSPRVTERYAVRNRDPAPR